MPDTPPTLPPGTVVVSEDLLERLISQLTRDVREDEETLEGRRALLQEARRALGLP